MTETSGCCYHDPYWREEETDPRGSGSMQNLPRARNANAPPPSEADAIIVRRSRCSQFLDAFALSRTARRPLAPSSCIVETENFDEQAMPDGRSGLLVRYVPHPGGLVDALEGGVRWVAVLLLLLLVMLL